MMTIVISKNIFLHFRRLETGVPKAVQHVPVCWLHVHSRSHECAVRAAGARLGGGHVRARRARYEVPTAYAVFGGYASAVRVY